MKATEQANPNEVPLTDDPMVSTDKTIEKIEEEPDQYEFCLLRNEKPVILEHNDDNGKKMKSKYMLKEMSGAERDKWMNDNNRQVGVDAQGNTIVKDFTNIQAKLISYCLFDPSGQRVSVEVISKWRCSIQDGLYKACQRLNALDKVGAAQAKKG